MSSTWNIDKYFAFSNIFRQNSTKSGEQRLIKLRNPQKSLSEIRIGCCARVENIHNSMKTNNWAILQKISKNLLISYLNHLFYTNFVYIPNSHTTPPFTTNLDWLGMLITDVTTSLASFRAWTRSINLNRSSRSIKDSNMCRWLQLSKRFPVCLRNACVI